MKTNIWFLSVLSLPLLGACELDDPCDPGQKYEYGVCLPGDVEAGDEDTGCDPDGAAEGGAGGAVECVEPPNPGAPCTEGGDECVGGAVCAAPTLPQCVAACGPDDAFFENCPAGTTCISSPMGSACF